MDAPLSRLLPSEPDPDALLEAFLEYTMERGLDLYSAQEEAILELLGGRSVILNTPTGSGKSLVATALCFKGLAERRRVFYTAPIKALVTEKFFAACRDFGPENVGMMTGDASVNRDANIVCCTAEILANISLREMERARVDYVVMDEFHYYADRDRGWAWQVPLLTLPASTRFLLMSATLGDTTRFEEALLTQSGEEPAVIKTAERPVPLDFSYRLTPIHETVQDLFEANKAPIYLVHFTQRSAAEQAQALTSLDFLTKDQKSSIKEALLGFRFDTPFGKDLRRWVAQGIGVHHAGLLPKYRLLVEKLAQQGLLKVICGTDTLGVGVNIPIRCVLFTQLCKYDGKKTGILSVRDFKQIAGRAGRKGFDEEGSVVCQAPEHVIENVKARMKAGDDQKRLRKVRTKKAPERGYAHWDEQTFERLIESDPERLDSSFDVTHSMLLQVLDREDGDGCRRLKNLIRATHEPPKQKFQHGRTAIAMFRSLLSAGIVEMTKQGVRGYVDVKEELQVDFSLHQSLSLYVVEAIEVLDRESESYAFDAISLVEATLEDPTAVLYGQLDKKKGALVADLKAQGVEYEERMKELEKVDIDRPNLDLINATFEIFREHHPWVGHEPVRPKSVAREILERSMSFNDYVKEYGLSRTEGSLMRYLSQAFKAIVQSIPEAAKTDHLYDLSDELGAIVREVDSSLLDEWERMKDPAKVVAAEPVEQGAPDVTTDRRAFTAMVRNVCYRLLRCLAMRNWEDAAELTGWTIERFEQAVAPYFEDHDAIRMDPGAKNPRNTIVEDRGEEWIVRQVLVDADEQNDWSFVGRVDLARARDDGRPTLELSFIGPS